MSNIYSVQFKDADGFKFELYSTAQKALDFAIQSCSSNVTPEQYKRELRKVRFGGHVWIYDKNDSAYIVRKEEIF